MTLAVTSCFQVDYDDGDGDYTTEYREYKGSQWPSTEATPDLIFWSIWPISARRILTPKKM